MKSCFVADLKDGQAISSLFLVREKEIRNSPRTGRSWLQLDLADCTGSIEAKMWDNFAEIALTFEREDIVKVRGRVKLYNDQKELTLEQVLRAAEHEFDLADFLPHTKADVNQLEAQLRQTVGGIQNPWLKQLLSSFLDDPSILPKFKRAPAAMTMHHAYLGGLLEHVVSLCGLVRAVAAHYPELDVDLLLTGAILHDMGKIEELSYERGFGYTTRGRLLGHIVIGAALVRKKVESIHDFPEDLATLVEHLLLSHHGTHEFGSPSVPQFREAVVLHYLDDLDSKMGAMRVTLDGVSSLDGWTERNPSLRRALLRTDEFLQDLEKVKEIKMALSGSAAPEKKL
ncbi:MAG: HD domain-containing protein [Candidatus Acidiferrales bacterium]|jgi:3'-5' exoribonuclease